MEKIGFSFAQFLKGLSRYGLLTPFPARRYPFGNAEKKLTDDWYSVGDDLRTALKKIEKNDGI